MRPLRELLRRQLGFVPAVMAPMGKWEPTMRMEDCLREVAARAAAVVALAEALGPGEPTPFLISAEGHLRGQPRPGCLMAAEILVELGAPPARIRCWAAANRTVDEVLTFHRMRQLLGGGGLLLLTSAYHVPRTRHILRRELPGVEPIRVERLDGPLVQAALQRLPAARSEALRLTLARGQRRGLQHLPTVLTEAVAFLTGALPPLERLIADTFRGAVDPGAGGMFQPP